MSMPFSLEREPRVIDMMPHLYRSEDLLIFHEEKKCTIHPIGIRGDICRDDIEELFEALSDEKPPGTCGSRLKISPFREHGEIARFMVEFWKFKELHYYNLDPSKSDNTI